MRTSFIIAVVTLFSTGCARERDPAPTEMVDLVRYLFQHWEDPELATEGLDNLLPWMQANVDTEEAKDGFRLDPLATEDVSTVDHPGGTLSSLLGAAGGAVSPFPVEDHAGHIVLEDQLFSNPSQYNHYVRIVDGDSSAFRGGEGLVRTDNDVETANFGVSIPYRLFKDYRWLEGETARGIAARSWIRDPSCSDSGNNCLEQSFSVDLFVADGNQTLRLTATWSEATTALVLGDDLLIAGLAMGLQNVFEATDEYLEEQSEG